MYRCLVYLKQGNCTYPDFIYNLWFLVYGINSLGGSKIIYRPLIEIICVLPAVQIVKGPFCYANHQGLMALKESQTQVKESQRHIQNIICTFRTSYAHSEHNLS